MTSPLNNRRSFLKNLSLFSAPVLLPGSAMAVVPEPPVNEDKKGIKELPVNFMYEGFFFSPEHYLEKLVEINQKNSIELDYYGAGGPTEMLEKEFAKITGKEKAIYFPTGTMANQVAMKTLNGDHTKVAVPENSHIYRDEGDAAQSVHRLRLIPLGKGKPFYDLQDLKTAIVYSENGFHYDSGLGTIVVENPVRREQNCFVPIKTIKELSVYARKNGYKLHLDGARLHVASAYSGVSVSEYASYFDTVYISLYKYLNAGGGAVLCGDAGYIDTMAHHIKTLGGSILRNWSNTAMALHYLAGIDERWQQVIHRANQLIAELNHLEGVEISPFHNGTNGYKMNLAKRLDPSRIMEHLSQDHILWSTRKSNDGDFLFVVNESILTREIPELAESWKKAMKQAHR